EHGPLELRGRGALQVEVALRARRGRFRILGPTVRAEHAIPPCRPRREISVKSRRERACGAYPTQRRIVNRFLPRNRACSAHDVERQVDLDVLSVDVVYAVELAVERAGGVLARRAREARRRESARKAFGRRELVVVRRAAAIPEVLLVVDAAAADVRDVE